MDADALVQDYLGRLETAAARLPVGRRAELVVEVRDHIATAQAEAGRQDEPTTRDILDRLGPPEEIVAAEEPEAPAAAWTAGPPPASIVAGSSIGAVEVVALLLLTLGAFLLPFVGPLIGLVFVWLSDRWNRSEKLVATAIVGLLIVLPLVVLFGVGVGAASG